MIISRSRGFIFLKIPKTASTSLGQFIINSMPHSDVDSFAGMKMSCYDLRGKFKEMNPHVTLDELIVKDLINNNDIENLKIFAMMRNPIDRFLSAAHHMHALDTKSQFSTSSDNEVARKYIFGQRNIKNDSFFAPQTKWMYHNGRKVVKLFKYPQFSELFAELKIEETDLGYKHNSEFRKNKEVSLDQDLENLLSDYYREDMEIWNSL